MAEALEQSLEVSHRGGADTVYQVGVETIQREGLAEQYSYETDADLFLWVSQMLRDLLSTTSNADFSDAVAAAKAQHVSRRFRKTFLRERSTPLPRSS